MTYAEMYEIAKNKLNPRKLNKHAKICDAVAVIETASGKVYVGVSLVATCGVGYCAEQAALSQMLNEGESVVSKILVLEKCGAILTPCGRCVELITQININNKDTDIFLSKDNSIKLAALMPYDWKNIKDGFREKLNG